MMRFGSLKPGSVLKDAKKHLFARIDAKAYLTGEQTEPLKNKVEKKKKQPEAEKKPDAGMDDLISIDDFAKVQLRVAKILEAEKVEKSKKLIKMKVSLGEEERQIVAGIRAWYDPESLVGKKIIIVKNLQPATLRGVESQGMLLAAMHENELALLTLDRDLPAGAKIS